MPWMLDIESNVQPDTPGQDVGRSLEAAVHIWQMQLNHTGVITGLIVASGASAKSRIPPNEHGVPVAGFNFLFLNRMRGRKRATSKSG